MYKIGITGSIGTGKTTIANQFALFNIPVFDADKEIKKILNKEKIKQKLVFIWPQISEKNEINKSKLKVIIFSNKKEKKKLEKLLYPYLEIEKNKFTKTNLKKRILVYDIPLIYETKSETQYDLIILTNCNKKLQKKREIKRDKISNSLFENIVKSQLSFHEKKKFKPKIIDTGKSKFLIFINITFLLFSIYIGINKIWNKKES